LRLHARQGALEDRHGLQRLGQAGIRDRLEDDLLQLLLGEAELVGMLEVQGHAMRADRDQDRQADQFAIAQGEARPRPDRTEIGVGNDLPQILVEFAHPFILAPAELLQHGKACRFAAIVEARHQNFACARTPQVRGGSSRTPKAWLTG
jgi:hypothetical protein